MKDILRTYKECFGEQEFIKSIVIGFLFFLISLAINYSAGIYATLRESNYVTDLLLSNLPTFDVDWVFVYGAIIFWIATILLLFKDPRLIPFSLKSIALFIIIRAFFVSLTHLGPFPDQSPISSNFILNRLTFGGDLFFSGHTGLPFLMALMFWNNKYLRYLFLSASLIFGISVILGHNHYSIDVFAAYFITYSIFKIAKTFFAADYKIFRKSPAVSTDLSLAKFY